MSGAESRSPRSAYALAALLTATGSAHFLVPAPFVRIVPRRLPARRALVYLSGAAELACATGLVHPRTRRPAAMATGLLLVAVFPGNVDMAMRSRRRSAAYRLAAWARLPLQVPLVVWAVSIARQPSVRRG